MAEQLVIHPVPSSPNSRQSKLDEESPTEMATNTLTSSELQSVASAFKTDIKEGFSPRKKQAIQVMRGSKTLSKPVESEGKVKSVIDHVRYLIKTKETVDPFDLPTEPTSSRTDTYVSTHQLSLPSAASCESGRLHWTEEETAAIEAALSSYDRLPRIAEIREIFSKSTILCRIMKENSFERVRNKVKNVFRKR